MFVVGSHRLIALAAVVAFVVGACAGSAPASSPSPVDTPSATSTLAPETPTLAPATDIEPVGDVEEATVVRVVDGDTIIIDRGRGRERLRYIGVDAPESVKPDTPVEFMGKEASAANEALVGGRTVWLERDVSDRDRFDRLLRYVWLRDGDAWILVNLELVRQGYAQVSTFPPDIRWSDVFRDAQRAAREGGLGLWGPATPAP